MSRKEESLKVGGGPKRGIGICDGGGGVGAAGRGKFLVSLNCTTAEFEDPEVPEETGLTGTGISLTTGGRFCKMIPAEPGESS